MKRNNIVIMKQDKGRVVVIMDKSKCRERFDLTINETVPETKLGPCKINRGKCSTHGKNS